MTDISDDELIVMYREGDPDAFDTLFDRYHAPVYNLARIMLSDPSAAEDIMQETFLSVARTAKRYEPRGFFRTWIMRIARNRSLNYIKADRLRRRAAAESGLQLLDAPSTEAPPDRLETDEKMNIIHHAMKTLPERQREAIALYAFERMKYREIADVIELPLNTVKTLIHRARAALAAALDGAPKEIPNDLHPDL